MADLLAICLQSDTVESEIASDGRKALELARAQEFDLVLLDLGLPDMDGLAVLRRLREWSEVPVVILTVRDDEAVKVTALDSGADDYVTKPFSTPELLARLRAAQRHARSAEDSAAFTAGGLVVDLAARTVSRAGAEIHLTATEFALLRLFIRHSGRVLTHKQILREVWGPKAEEQRQYLRVHIANLRKKIEPPGRTAPLLRTEPGIGYRLVEPQ